MIFGFFKKKPAKIQEEVMGEVSHYFSHNKACVVNVRIPLEVGDTVHIKGHTTDFKQKVDSMQIDGNPITSAKAGQEIGLRVKGRVRTTDTVYKVMN